jgi:hypothetical protein
VEVVASGGFEPRWASTGLERVEWVGLADAGSAQKKTESFIIFRNDFQCKNNYREV